MLNKIGLLFYAVYALLKLAGTVTLAVIRNKRAERRDRKKNSEANK